MGRSRQPLVRPLLERTALMALQAGRLRRMVYERQVLVSPLQRPVVCFRESLNLLSGPDRVLLPCGLKGLVLGRPAYLSPADGASWQWGCSQALLDAKAASLFLCKFPGCPH